MPDQPERDDVGNSTRPIWTSAQKDEPGDYVTLGGPLRPAGRSRRRTIVAAAVVAMLGGAWVAYAVNSSGLPHPTAASQRADFLPAPAMGPGLIGGMLGTVRGQMVVAKPGGGYQTVDVQRGTVTAVNASSITVRSANGFSATYAVSAATEVGARRAGIGRVKTGDQVALQATVSGPKATATSIADLTLLLRSRRSAGHGNSSGG